MTGVSELSKLIETMTAYQHLQEVARLIAMDRPTLLPRVVDLMESLAPRRIFANGVSWDGHVYEFTSAQHAVIRKLWAATIETGAPRARTQKILEDADVESGRLSDLFRTHAAFRVLIHEADGWCWLGEPAEKKVGK